MLQERNNHWRRPHQPAERYAGWKGQGQTGEVERAAGQGCRIFRTQRLRCRIRYGKLHLRNRKRDNRRIGEMLRAKNGRQQVSALRRGRPRQQSGRSGRLCQLRLRRRPAGQRGGLLDYQDTQRPHIPRRHGRLVFGLCVWLHSGDCGISNLLHDQPPKPCPRQI